MDLYRMGADAYYNAFKRFLRPRSFHMLTQVLKNAPEFDRTIHRFPALMMMARRFSDFRDRQGDERIRSLFQGLTSGLDDQSIHTLSEAWDAYLMIADKDRIPFDKWYPPLEKSFEEEMDRYLVALGRSLKPPAYIDVRHFPDIFFFDSGLSYVPKSTIDAKLTGRDVIDCGGYTGDTSLMYSRKYSPRRIYAFEPLKENFARLNYTIGHCSLSNVVPLKLALGSEKKTSMLIPRDSGSYLDPDSADGEPVEVDTIDSFVEKTGAEPALIKMDIEGAELDAIKGALGTIKRFRPILSIAVYHTPQDLFMIKPLLESEVKGYRFMVRKLEYCDPVAEMFLIAYPLD